MVCRCMEYNSRVPIFKMVDKLLDGLIANRLAHGLVICCTEYNVKRQKIL